MKKEDDKTVELIEDDEVITLYDDNNNPVDFYEVACVEYEDNYYALMQPVEPIEGIGEDEAIIFRLEEQDDDTDLFLPVDDESVLEAVFNEYIKAVSDDACGCGHDHCDCGDDCDCGEGECDCGEEGCDCGHDHCDGKH